jgi:hypothetical protein
MRTRTKETIGESYTVGYHDLIDPFTGVSYGPYSYSGWQASYSSITDEWQVPNRENTCFHETWTRQLISQAEIPRFRLESPHTNIRRVIRDNYVPTIGAQECFEHAAVAIPGVPGTFDAQALQLAQDMWSSIRPSMEGDFSIINFILELKDMADIMHLYRDIRKAWKVRKDLNPLYRRRMADRSDRLLSGGVLAYQFGIKPFLDDVYNVFKQLSTFKSKLDALVRGENKTHRKHVMWMRSLNIPADQKDLSTVVSSGMPGALMDRTWQREPYRVNGTFVYRYTMPDANGWRSKVGGFLDALGLNVNPAIIWNAIPFTFVVDWFFNVSKWLHSLRMESLGILVRLESCSVSCKTKASCNYTYKWPQASWAQTCVVVRRVAYRRLSIDPAAVMGAIEPSWRTPSGSAVVSAVALGHQLSGTGRKTGSLRKQLGRVPLVR